MRALRGASVAVSAVLVASIVFAIALVVFLPMTLIEKLGEGRIDPIFAGVMGFLSIVAGASIAFFAVVVGIPMIVEYGIHGGEDRRLLIAYRARQRAMLEELDEVKRLLEEIRDILRSGVGE